jgi:tetrapyrrole methylase family protein/MazG family protein
VKQVARPSEGATAAAIGGVVGEIAEHARHHENVVLAALGNPLDDDPLARATREQAGSMGIQIETVAGVGLLDTAVRQLGLDVYASGLQVVGSAALGGPGETERTDNAFLGVYRSVDPARPLLVRIEEPSRSATVMARVLRGLYPASHLLRVARFPSTDPGSEPETMTLEAVAGIESAGGPVFVYLPPADRHADEASFDTLRFVVARLRGPGGCPWDREQTLQSIKKHLIEETYEAVDALDREEYHRFAEELGDVLLQVVMYAQLGREAGRFTLEDVLAAVNAKLVRRHPHVFGEVQVSGSADVLKNWERIKRAEKGEAATTTFAGVPEAAPALMRADAVQSRAGRYGWVPSTTETDCAAPAKPDLTDEARLAALGSSLFQLVTLARRFHLDPEEALRLATNRFIAAFERVLADCQRRGVAFDALPEAQRQELLSQSLRDVTR